MRLNLQIVFDCSDPASLSSFWASALGYKIEDPPAGFDSWPAFLTSIGVPESDFNKASAIVDPDGLGPRIFFHRLKNPKPEKNRLHLDMGITTRGAALEEKKRVIGARVAELESLGATRLYCMEEHGDFWITMADPEGNEFCIQ